MSSSEIRIVKTGNSHGCFPLILVIQMGGVSIISSSLSGVSGAFPTLNVISLIQQNLSACELYAYAEDLHCLTELVN